MNARELQIVILLNFVNCGLLNELHEVAFYRSSGECRNCNLRIVEMEQKRIAPTLVNPFRWSSTHATCVSAQVSGSQKIK